MKVLLVTNQVFSDTGSTYMCTANMYDIVKRYARLGSVFISAVKYDGNNSHTKIESDLYGYIKYGDITFHSKDYVFMSRENKRLITTLVKDVDLVISYAANYDLYVIAKQYNKKFMTYVVSCAWDAYWNHGWQGKILAPYKFLKARLCIKKSDYVLYVSNKFLQNRYPTNAKFHIGCSDVKIKPMEENILNRRLEFLNRWNGDILKIVTTAAVDVAYKGQQYVIEAMGKLKQKGITNLHYYLIGGGSQNRLKSIVKKYQLESQVYFLGIVPHEDVFDVLDDMHLYIQPSLQEGLPRSMVEAMSRGLMCAGANTAAIPELIQSNYVLPRKSVHAIITLLSSINKQILLEQAKVNFDEAKKYQEYLIEERREVFFDNIKKDIQG